MRKSIECKGINKNIRLFIVLIILLSLVGSANAATYNRVLNGDFTGDIDDWDTYTYATATVTYDAGTGDAKLYTNGGGSPVARIYQTVDLTDVNTLSVTFTTGADWNTDATFIIKVDGDTKYSSGTVRSSYTTNIDVSGYTGDNAVWIYVIGTVSGSNAPDTAYVEDVEALATVVPATNLKILNYEGGGDLTSGIGYYPPNTEVWFTSTYTEGDPPVNTWPMTVESGTEGVDWDYTYGAGNLRKVMFYNIGDYDFKVELKGIFDGIQYTVSNTTTGFINISAATYDWTLNFFDSGGSPITSSIGTVLYTDTVLNTSSTNAGTIKFNDLAAGSYACEISSGGVYLTTTEYVVLGSDTTTNVTLTANTNYQNIYPSPNVKLNFRGSYGESLINYTIYSTFIASPGNQSWFDTIFGYSDSSIIATPLTQRTDQGGNAVLPYLPTATYNIKIYNPSGVLISEIELNPVQNGEYQFNIRTRTALYETYGSEADVANVYINTINSSVYLIGVNYSDYSSTTSSMNFFVNKNNAVYYTESIGGAVYTHNFSIEINNTADDVYTWGIIAQTSAWGNITKARSFTCRGGEKLVDLGIDGDYLDIYIWISIILLFVFGAMFSQTSAEIGAIMLGFFAGGLYYIDWFDGNARLIRITAAFVLAALVLFKLNYKGGG